MRNDVEWIEHVNHLQRVFVVSVIVGIVHIFHMCEEVFLDCRFIDVNAGVCFVCCAQNSVISSYV